MQTFIISKVLLLVFFIIGIFSNAQISISGKVYFKSKGVKDISVTLKDSYDGATTDANGNYSFETSEKGQKTLVFSNSKFVEVEKSIVIENEDLSINSDLKEQISEIDAVVISAGSIEASDKKRATTLLTPIDIYTTAGANGQVSSALETLPGVQKIGEAEGLFVRGGTGNETKFFMDGNLVNNFFGNSIPGVKSMDRLNTSLFKGNIFSSGGYSAVYGQALSSVLVLESIDFPERNSIDLGISPLFLTAGFQNVNEEKSKSFGIFGSYSNLELMTKLIKFNNDFTKAPESFGTNFNFRIKNKNGGILKYYGSFDTNKIDLQSQSLEPNIDFDNTSLKGKNTFHNLSFKQKFGQYLLSVGTSYTFNSNDIDLSNTFQNNEINSNSINIKGNYFNVKGVLERKINKISAVRAGIEFNQSKEKTEVAISPNPFQSDDQITSLFAETDLGFSNNLSAKLGLRSEYSSELNHWNLAPRLAMAYRLSKKWTTSLAYGIFYQNPEQKYFGSDPLNYQKAEHYIFQVQKSEEGRSFRLEAFYKNYTDLIKNKVVDFRQTAINNNGDGFAKGFEVFWRDKKSIKDIDYWVSYSYLDSKRNFENYDQSLFPNFAAKHTLSVVAKKFVTDWKTGFNLSYTYASGRPFYNFQTDNNGDYHLNNQGKLKDYNALNFSLNYLPNLGKKDSKAFTILVLSVNNILGQKNIYGYQFSNDGLRSRPILPSASTFVFIGAFINFGIDRTQDAINNNL
ncbi:MULTISPECIES: TonB-dependent receptor [unclassified Kaistella]|uniref:TonB-dependent receptor n=1 Tax=unclassified Kaistella TaxID=2762626 RepID=UPI0027347905|nr:MULTISPECIES: TonB-dependent receptor [unclassified Kaistella]MDP2452955.1 TonB-dependent receptor [Kaistella sp. SH11-4b]MDP2455864.1 TonB-dependent receptor [Kaistella sp. SH40-3]MDP2458768.1 TonB-dependent receptor [Kaistella sp. SH19-2b]